MTGQPGGPDSGSVVSTLLRGRPATEAEWAALVQPLLDDGQYFLAFDVVRQALDHHPASLRLTLLGALALVRSGAVVEARRLLDPVDGCLETAETRLRRAWAPLREVIGHLTTAAPGALSGDEPDPAALDSLRRLALGLQDVAAFSQHRLDDPDMLRLVVQIYRATSHGLQRPDDLRRARDAAFEVYRLTRSPLDGIALATLAWISGDRGLATPVATEVAAALSDPPPPGGRVGGAGLTGSGAPALAEDGDAFPRISALGLALLLLGRAAEATAVFARAAAAAGRRYSLIVGAVRDLRLLAAHGVAVPESLTALLKPPKVVVFAGPPISPAGSAEPIFPPFVEPDVRAAIAAAIDASGADIGFCSAACGSDLLFAELMLERGAEVNLFLPFAVEDFLTSRVAYAGERWVRRFHNILKLAASVTRTTEDRYLGHDALFRFNNQMIMGMARLRANVLLTEPHLTVVWDYTLAPTAGSVSDFIDHWPDIGRLRMIDLDDIRTAATEARPEAAASLVGDAVVSPPSPIADAAPGGAVAPSKPLEVCAQINPCLADGGERTIRGMLFADMVGFSKLKEEHLPRLWAFVAAVERDMTYVRDADLLIESWGDGLYVNLPTAMATADYAFTLLEAMQAVDWRPFGLPYAIRMRIALHAGPVFRGIHPLNGRPIVYGSHVSRAARIEPVTVPDNIYASQQFVALLTAEENMARHEALALKKDYHETYVAEYLGILSLAKNYGQQPVYHLRRARTTSPDDRAET